MSTKPLSFEQALQKLEELVSGVESGELDLEKSLKAFEEGNKLIATCRSHLDSAEMKIEKIIAEGGLAKSATPFEGEI